MTNRVGQQLGNYRLVRFLGAGGFAEVYLGEHTLLGMPAAIKILDARLQQQEAEKFQEEARTIARLIHPQIIRLLEFGIDGTTPFMVMDYAPNGTLKARHPKGIQLPLPTVVSYVKQIADGLQFAHDETYIHRDIKPENILVGRRNEILLSDFGIAVIAHSTLSRKTEEVIGTPSYMAPEQIQKHPTPASDQYALGVMVYQWLSGTLPFEGTSNEALFKHLSIPPPPLHTRVSAISPAVEQVVLTALAKDPKQRFASVQEFAQSLEQASKPEQSTLLPSVTSHTVELSPEHTPVLKTIELQARQTKDQHLAQVLYLMRETQRKAQQMEQELDKEQQQLATERQNLLTLQNSLREQAKLRFAIQQAHLQARWTAALATTVTVIVLVLIFLQWFAYQMLGLSLLTAFLVPVFICVILTLLAARLWASYKHFEASHKHKK